MSDKKLVIGSDVKGATAGLRQIEKLLKSLSKEGDNFSKVFKDLNNGSKPQSLGMFSKNVALMDKAMLKSKGITESTAKVMRNIYLKNVQDQTKQVDILSKRIENLNKVYAKSPVQAQKGIMSQGQVGNRIAGLQAQLSAAHQQLGMLNAVPGGAQAHLRSFAGAAGGIASAAGGAIGGPAGAAVAGGTSLALKMAAASVVAGAVTEIIGSVAKTYQSSKNMELRHLSGIKSFEKGLLTQDAVSTAYFMAKKHKSGVNWAQHAMDVGGGTTASKMGAASDIVGGVLGLPGAAVGTVIGAATGGGGGGGLGGSVSGLYSKAKWFGTGGERAAEAASVGESVELLKSMSPVEQAVIQNLQQTAGARVAAGKGLQGKHMRAAGAGMGFGLGAEESFGFFQQMANQGGMAGLFGKTTGGPGLADAGFEIEYQNAKAKRGFEAGKDTSLLSDIFAGNANVKSVAASVGGTASYTQGRGEMALQLERMGMDRGVGGGIVNQLFGSAGGDLVKTKDELEKIISVGFQKGIKDGKFHEKVGETVASYAIGYGGEAGNLAAMAQFAYAGLGSKSTMADIQGNLGGLQEFSKMGENQAFKMMRVARASGMIGESGTGTQMMALANMPIEQLMTNPKMMEKLGYSRDMQRELVRGTMQDIKNVYMPGMEGQSIEDKSYVLAANMGIDQKKAFGMLKGFEAFDQGQSSDQIKGVMGKLGHGDGLAEASVATETARQFKLLEEENLMRAKLNEAMKESLTLTAIAVSNKDNTGFESFKDVFTELTATLQNLNSTLGGKNQSVMQKVNPRTGKIE